MALLFVVEEEYPELFVWEESCVNALKKFGQ
jgi:hypothetical protein